MKILSVKKATENPFLNMYDVEFEDRLGNRRMYYLASRAARTEDLKLKTHENHPEGVIIYCVYGENQDRLVLVRQYRVSIDDYIYEFPAGLVDEGETYAQAGIRELKEEPGVDFRPLEVDEMYHKPFYTTIGMTDEACATVYGYADGEVSRAGLEDSEELEIVLADRTEAARILREERVSMNCGYLIMHFLHHTDEDPFYFLK